MVEEGKEQEVVLEDPKETPQEATATQETETEEKIEFKEFPEGTEVIEDDTVSDEQAQKLMDELKSGKRYFEAQEPYNRLYVRTPTVDENQEASLVYAKIFNKAILQGIEPSDSLEKKLVEKGIIEDYSAKDSEMSKAQANLIKSEALLSKFESSNKSKQVKKIARKVADARNEILEVNSKRQNLLSNSADNRADEVRNGFLISRVTHYSDTDERVWETYADFLSETDYLLVGRVTFEFLTFSYGLSSAYMENFPELAFLQDE